MATITLNDLVCLLLLVPAARTQQCTLVWSLGTQSDIHEDGFSSCQMPPQAEEVVATTQKHKVTVFAKTCALLFTSGP